MTINLKFLEMWYNGLSLVHQDEAVQAQQQVLKNLIDLAKHQHPKYRSLKSFVKYEVLNVSSTEPDVRTGT